MKHYHVPILVNEQDSIDRASIPKGGVCLCGLISVYDCVFVCVCACVRVSGWLSGKLDVCMSIEEALA